VLALGAFVAGVLGARDASATFRYGDIQISGNLQTQNLIRLQNGTSTFEAFNSRTASGTRSACSTSRRREARKGVRQPRRLLAVSAKADFLGY